MVETIALIGYGQHAKEFAAILKQLNYNVVFYVNNSIKDENVFPMSKFDPLLYKTCVAIGDSVIRRNIIERELPKNTRFLTFVHPTALIIDPDTKIGEGTVVYPNCVITSNVTLGKHCLVNVGATISHDCQLGDYTTVCPKATICGNCSIGSNVFIGANATIKDQIQICDDVVVGLNTGVVKHIVEKGTYVGTPAIKLSKYK